MQTDIGSGARTCLNLKKREGEKQEKVTDGRLKPSGLLGIEFVSEKVAITVSGNRPDITTSQNRRLSIFHI